MADDFSIVTGSGSVRITGLAKTARALKKAGADSQDMKELMYSIGMVVVNAARIEVPKKTGALEASIRAGHGQTKAVVRAGYARVPYAGVINYGWPSRGIAATHFLNDAANRNRGKALSMLDDGIKQIIKRNDLA